MPKKKQKASGDHEAETSVPPCQAPGCTQPGQYKAPKSKSALHDYDWYCLDHVRARNQEWDYFAGMTRDEIESFMRDAVTGHRPTWNREAQAQRQYDRLQAALEEFMHLSAMKVDKSVRLPPKVREALAVMDMEYPYTQPALKQRWRALVKRLHPDINRDDPRAEEKFKRLAVAYLLLTEHLKHL